MRSGIAAVRANAKRKRIHAEKTRILNKFAADPSAKDRAVTEVVKIILLNGPYLLNGKVWEVKAKSLGAGVYELSLEEER